MDMQKVQKILTDSINKQEVQDGESYLEFSIGQELYAVPLLIVKEVLPETELTPIPRTPKYIRGMMNLRGQVITVADLAIKLNLTKLEDTKNKVIMILQKEDIQMGVVVDIVHQVLHLTDEDITQSNGTESEISMQFVKGIHQKDPDSEVTLILDMIEALNINELL